MKDLSLFLLKNFLAAKLRKGFKSFCNGVGSTSTLNQQQHVDTMVHEESVMDSYSPTPHSNSYLLDKTGLQPTLEEMILQLDLEEKMSLAAKSRGKLEEYDNDDDTLHHVIHHRMSCVNSSDILRSARNALNQYPRFSLDGKDAMYRSSFGPVKPIMWRHHPVDNRRRHLLLPPKIGGDSVVWCKAGVVATLMGLEAMPVPIPPVKISNSTSTRHHVISKKQHQLSWKGSCERRGGSVVDSKSRIQFRLGDGDFGSCSKNGCCIANPSVPKRVADELAGWPMRRFL